MHLPVLMKCKVPLMHPMRMSCFLGEYCENFIRVQGGSFGSIQNLKFKRLGLLTFYRIKDTCSIYYSQTNAIIHGLFQRYTQCFTIQQINYYRLENDGWKLIFFNETLFWELPIWSCRWIGIKPMSSLEYLYLFKSPIHSGED